MTSDQAHLNVRIIRIPEDHPTSALSLLDLIPENERAHAHIWAGNARQMVAWGQALTLEVSGENSIRHAAQRWEEVRASALVTCEWESTYADEVVPAVPVAFASFGFHRTSSGFLTVPAVAVIEMPVSDEAPAERWGTPWGGWSGVRKPRFVVTAAWKGNWLGGAAPGESGELVSVSFSQAEGAGGVPAKNVALDPGQVLVALEEVALRQCGQGRSVASAQPQVEDILRGLEYETLPGRMTQSQWREQVGQVIEALQAGAAQKVVMSRDMRVRASGVISQVGLVSRLAHMYPTTWVFAVGGLVGATPEMLAARHKGQVFSRVLAGTLPPGRGEELFASMKDRTEHMFAVESVARALAPISDSLDVPDVPFVLDLPNVSHLATDVRAVLNGGNLLDVVAALHPTAAVCGTPTVHAYELIDKFEKTERGRYSGPVGWIDGAGEGEFGIALRCGQLSPDAREIRLFAGGGIMPDSVPEKELAETQAKMAPVLQALGVGGGVDFMPNS